MYGETKKVQKTYKEWKGANRKEYIQREEIQKSVLETSLAEEYFCIVKETERGLDPIEQIFECLIQKFGNLSRIPVFILFIDTV